jgi:hypothetical protein
VSNGHRPSQQQRIEQKLDRVIAHVLGGPDPATGQEVIGHSERIRLLEQKVIKPWWKLTIAEARVWITAAGAGFGGHKLGE